tara:strand:- start:1721 stop:2443 length:723 start_codon:yes stop_codon:yes gene_type:complete
MSRFVKLAGQASTGSAATLPEDACFTSVTSKGYKFCDTVNERQACVAPPVVIMNCPNFQPTTTNLLITHNFYNYCCICMDMTLGGTEGTSSYMPCIRLVFNDVLEDCQHVYRILRASCGTCYTICCHSYLFQGICRWTRGGSFNIALFPVTTTRVASSQTGPTVGFNAAVAPTGEANTQSDTCRMMWGCGYLNNCFLCCRPQWCTFNGICLSGSCLSCNYCNIQRSFRIVGHLKQTEEMT